MRVVVTGGKGFVGRHLVKKLKKDGNKIFTLDKHAEEIKDSYSIKCNLQNRKEIIQILNGIRPDIIIHLAGRHNIPESEAHPNLYIKNNISGTVNVLEYIKSINKKPKLILASSAGALYTKGALPYTEKSHIDPSSIYGKTKAIEEDLIMHYALHLNFSYQIMRISNIYGPGQERYKHPSVVPNIIINLIKKNKVLIFGNGTQTRDFIYIDDVINAFAILLKSQINGFFNISSEKETSINELYKLICKQLNMDYELYYKHTLQSKGVVRSFISNKKMFQEFQWKPSVGLEEGLGFTYLHLKKKLSK